VSLLPTALLYTRDPQITDRIRGALVMVARVLPAASVDELDRLLAQHDPALVIADMRDGAGGQQVLEFIRRWPQTVFIALGDRRSDPLRLAMRSGAFGAEDLDPDLWRLQSLVDRGLESLQLRREVAILQERTPETPSPPPAIRGERVSYGVGGATPLWHLSLAMRNIEDVGSLFVRTVEGISAAMLLSRVGVFARDASGGGYRLRAGSGCLEHAHSASFEDDDPLVRWMERHSHLVSLPLLAHIARPEDRLMLNRALDTMGAEAIAPFFARGRLYGWLFVGRRATGAPFTYADLEELAVLTGHVSTMIENAYLYEEAARQRTLAETLLHSIPSGILAVAEDGAIRWCNAEAARILGAEAGALVGKQVEAAGSRLADILRRALTGGGADGEAAPAREWTDPASGALVSVIARRLVHGAGCLGAVAILNDRTESERLARRTEELERSAFWNDLAAAMSHEIRNPLTAIKTYAQLLPKRYADPEFREEFHGLVSEEVVRLQRIVEAIESFAHPAEPRWGPVDIPRMLTAAVETAKARVSAPGARVEVCVAENTPSVVGDQAALTEALAHLVTNAIESAADPKALQVVVAADPLRQADADFLMLMVRDNGPGIAPAVRDRIFSPFGTTKARGLGLGLPIVRRVVLDHGGRLQVDSCESGTRISLILPILPPRPSAGGAPVSAPPPS
jgi:nitrogen-specific signal transduction histidine kinase